MKQNFKLFATACLLMASMQAKADIAASVMLHHNGVATLYQWDEVQKAVDAAVDGDTIYLAEGSFSPFNVNKRIMVRGAGAGTMIEGDCYINIPGSEKIGMPVLDAMSFSGKVEVAQADRQLTFRKCKMKDLYFTGTEFRDVKMDRCHVYGKAKLTPNVKEFNAFSSMFAELDGSDNRTGNHYFNHCNFYWISDTITATFQSCILEYTRVSSNYGSFTPTLVSCVVEDSYIHGQVDNATVVTNSHVYALSEYVKSDGTLYLKQPENSIIDGTPVGAGGGQYPFSQNPDLPMVTKHSIVVDAANKKLNVTLTVEKK